MLLARIEGTAVEAPQTVSAELHVRGSTAGDRAGVPLPAARVHPA
jgi:hypothetical protein